LICSRPTYVDFGASLWAKEHVSELSIFDIMEAMYCHAFSLPWKARIVVKKPLHIDFGLSSLSKKLLLIPYHYHTYSKCKRPGR